MNPTPTAARPDHATNGADGAPRVVVPADIDAPDRIAWGLSFRQLAILAAGTAPLWLAYTRFEPLLPGLAWVGIAILVTAVTLTATLGRRDGLPLDVWVRHGLALHAGPRVLAPGIPEPGRPLVTTSPDRPVVPAPLRARAVELAPDGTLHVNGTARAVIACGTTGVTLRTGTEQAGLLVGLDLAMPSSLEVTAVAQSQGFIVNNPTPERIRLAPALNLPDEDIAAFLAAWPNILDTAIGAT